MKSRSCEIGCCNGRIALKFDRHLGSAAAKFQSHCKSLNPNLAASRLHETCGKTSYRLVNRGPDHVSHLECHLIRKTSYTFQLHHSFWEHIFKYTLTCLKCIWNHVRRNYGEIETYLPLKSALCLLITWHSHVLVACRHKFRSGVQTGPSHEGLSEIIFTLSTLIKKNIFRTENISTLIQSVPLVADKVSLCAHAADITMRPVIDQH